MSEKNLKEIISELLRLGYEGTYWDFKEDYTDCREDKLIDIICMANNIDGHQAYLSLSTSILHKYVSFCELLSPIISSKASITVPTS